MIIVEKGLECKRRVEKIIFVSRRVWSMIQNIEVSLYRG